MDGLAKVSRLERKIPPPEPGSRQKRETSLRPKTLADRQSEAGNVIFPGLDVDSQAVLTHRRGGDWTDGSGLQVRREGQLQREKIVNSRGTRERDQVRTFRAKTGQRPADVLRLRNGPVGDGDIDDGAEPRQ